MKRPQFAIKIRPDFLLLSLLLLLLIAGNAAAQNIPVSYMPDDTECLLEIKNESDKQVKTILDVVIAEDYRAVARFGEADTIRITYYYTDYTEGDMSYNSKRVDWLANAVFIREDDGRYIVRESRETYYNTEYTNVGESGSLGADAPVVGYSDNTSLYAVKALALLREQLSKTFERGVKLTSKQIVGSWTHLDNPGGSEGQISISPLLKEEEGYRSGWVLDYFRSMDCNYIFTRYIKPSPKYWETVDIGSEPGLDWSQVWAGRWPDLVFRPDGTFEYIQPVWYPEYQNDMSKGGTITYAGRWEISDCFLILYIATPETTAGFNESRIVHQKPAYKIVLEFNHEVQNRLYDLKGNQLPTWALRTRGFVRLDRPKQESDLVSIQKALKQAYHGNPYDYQNQEERFDAFEAWRDSLQNSFYSVMAQICRKASAMEYPFTQLKDEVKIAQSPDHEMRVFSRNTYMGGSMPFICSYVQYFSGDSVRFAYLPDMETGDEYNLKKSNDSGYYYDAVFMHPCPRKICYLLAGMSQIATATPIAVLRAVSIGDDGRIMNEPIFQTADGPTNCLTVSYLPDNYGYDKIMHIGNENFPRIVYDDATQTILMPETYYSDELSSTRLTGKAIKLVWTGKLFVAPQAGISK